MAEIYSFVESCEKLFVNPDGTARRNPPLQYRLSVILKFRKIANTAEPDEIEMLMRRFPFLASVAIRPKTWTTFLIKNAMIRGGHEFIDDILHNDEMIRLFAPRFIEEAIRDPEELVEMLATNDPNNYIRPWVVAYTQHGTACMPMVRWFDV